MAGGVCAEEGEVLRRAVFAAVFLLVAGCGLALRPLLRRPVPVGLDDMRRDGDAAQMADAPWQPRTFYGRRLEPEGDALLHGAGQTDRASFDRYRAAVGPASAPMLFMTYVDLRDDLPEYFARLRADLQHFEGGRDELVVPQIGLSLNAGRAGGHYEAETAAGSDDAALLRMCDGLRSLDRPVFVRVGYEFNGPWNGYAPRAYVAAFRRFAAAMRACDAGRIALVWDWSADAEMDAEDGGADAGAERWREFYPGDDAVDWWGVNLFSAHGMRAVATRNFLRAADGSRHPVMIGESTPKGYRTVSHDVLEGWFRPYFGMMRSSPGVKAFCYIDWNWAGYPQWGDWGDARVEGSPALLLWYRQQVAVPVVRGARGRDATLRLLRTR